jgi:hypothetical protein
MAKRQKHNWWEETKMPHTGVWTFLLVIKKSWESMSVLGSPYPSSLSLIL